MLDLLHFLRNFAAFLVAIGVLVSIHEFGHYWVARRLGVKVLRFSLGFGKVLWTKRTRDGVEWTVSAVPLGGYVRMLDEREGVVAPSELHLAFNRQHPLKRCAIVVAGPLFNFMLAIALCWVVFVAGITDLRPLVSEPAKGSVAAQQGVANGDEIVRLGDVEIHNWATLQMELIDQSLSGAALHAVVKSEKGESRNVELPLEHVRRDPRYLFDDLGLAPYAPSAPPHVEEIAPGSPSENAGLKVGDSIVKAGDAEIHSPGELVAWSGSHPGEVAKLEVVRDGKPAELQVIVGRQIRDGKVVGFLGATVAPPRDLWNNLRAVYRTGPVDAIPAAAKDVWQMSALTLKLLYRMVLGEVSVKNISGPISIAQVAGISASIGPVYFLRMLAFISVGLGVLNLLPVPVLDGGHLLYYVVEMVKGSPLSERAQAIGVRIGLTLLVALMGLAFYNDIMGLVG